jgi:hypothetical protein
VPSFCHALIAHSPIERSLFSYSTSGHFRNRGQRTAESGLRTFKQRGHVKTYFLKNLIAYFLKMNLVLEKLKYKFTDIGHFRNRGQRTADSGQLTLNNRRPSGSVYKHALNLCSTY